MWVKVFYNDQDILGSNKDIKIVSIRLENKGRTILQSFFDQNIPFGLIFKNSRVLSVAPTSQTSDYLRENLFMEEQITNYDKGNVIFKKPILEKGAEASFKVYLLQDKGLARTAVTALGKISGLQTISVTRAETAADGAMKQRWSTEEEIGISFASGYFGVICLALTLVPISSYLERRELKEKKRKSRAFCAQEKSMTESQKRIVEAYEKGWQSYYIRTIGALASGDGAMDVSDLICFHLRKLNPLGLLTPLLPRLLRQLQPLRWDPEIFTVVDHNIRLNDENRSFLLRFLGQVDEISVEPSAAPNGGPAAPLGNSGVTKGSPTVS
jgi:hypothetical protein